MAAYCRVSTDKEDQVHSFESQQRYFREWVQREPEWELTAIYADEGLSGTSTKKRVAFHRMLQDARLHRFDRLLTKEVSRFSRNILDTISYTRELRQLGIGVLFLTDGIDTLEPDAELRLSILGSLAQEESRKTSTRVKWGQTRRMEQGVVFGRSLLGYDVRGGKLLVNPEGAKIVRLIFHKYVQEHKGTSVIARELREAGFRTLTGSTHWRNTVVLKILKNEKYCGDLKQKKTFTPDYLTHQKKYNHGEEGFVYLRDHHPPLVSRETWEAAQREMARRDIDGTSKTGHGNRYPLSGKVRCGLCGKPFVSRDRKRRDGSRYKLWRCSTKAAEGSPHRDPAGNLVGCGMDYNLPDLAALEAVKQTFLLLKVDRDQLIREVTALVRATLEMEQREKGASLGRLRMEEEHLEGKKKALLNAFLSREISREDRDLMNQEYRRQQEELSRKLEAAQKQPRSPVFTQDLEETLRQAEADLLSGHKESGEFLGHLVDHITAFAGGKLELSLQGLPHTWVFELTGASSNPTAGKA